MFSGDIDSAVDNHSEEVARGLVRFRGKSGGGVIW